MVTSSTTTEETTDDTSSKPQRRTLRRRLLRLVMTAFIAYVIVVLLMMWLESLLIFPTWQIPPGDWNPDGFAFEDVDFRSEDSTQLNGWYFEHAEPKAYVLYCHGNGEHLAHMGEYLDGLREEFRVSIFAFDYRGYGRSEGKPHEQGILADGRAAQQWLADRVGIQPEEIVLWGRSIGGAVAVQMGADQGARALILERTFTSLPDVAARHYPWLPVRRLMRNRFDSLSRISQYEGPVLQSHGTADEIVPLELAKELFQAVPGDDKQFVVMPGVTHNAPSTEDYYTELARFLDRLQ